MKSSKNLGRMKRLLTMYKIVGAMTLLWIIKAISIHIQVDGNSECEESTTSILEYERDQTLLEETITAGPIETFPIGQVTQENASSVQTKPVKYIEVSDEEIYALACLVWLEGRGESIECQEAIASVVINRYISDPDKYISLFDVIYEPMQFSPAGKIPNTTPTKLQIDIVNKIVADGPTIPEYVTYFRSSYFHNWGDQVPYKCMSNTYFSYSNALKDQLVKMEVTK